jgi:hypothetical protein
MYVRIRPISVRGFRRRVLTCQHSESSEGRRVFSDIHD